MINEFKRLKAGVLALMMSVSLTGCASSNGFEFVKGESRSIEASRYSSVNNTFINKCYVAEVYNKLKDENELYIVTESSFENCKAYNDVFTPYSIMFSDDNKMNEFFVFKRVIPLTDYVNALGLIKYDYSYEDLKGILDNIKGVHVFEDNLELTK